MRYVHKGFTLLELLVVIAIIGALSATMSVVTSGSTAKAKAAAIAANVDACKSAAMLYCLEHSDGDIDFTEVETDTVLYTYCKAWGDFSSGKITYKASDSSTGRDNWAVDVDFSGDPEAADIKTALAKIKGYGTYGDISSTSGKLETDSNNDRIKNYKFKVTLTSGKIEAIND